MLVVLVAWVCWVGGCRPEGGAEGSSATGLESSKAFFDIILRLEGAASTVAVS